uniref:CoA-transferase family III n=1 Tax=Psilocybe cubensis TaxID=181762 RepID=A0A8H8CFM0_PSICU
MPSDSNPIPEALKAIWISNGLPEHFLNHLKLKGDADTAVPSSFRLGLAAQISIGLAGLSAAYVHYLRTGVEQDVTVDARHAVLSFHSEAWYTINDALPPGDLWDNIAGLHRAGVLDILKISDSPTLATRDEVAAAIRQWDGQSFEDECAKSGMCVFKLRKLEEWKNSPHGKALDASPVPVVQIYKIGEAKKKIISGGESPLDGIRVLDLSRVLAGPVAGRNLAAQGAQVLLITSPKLPSLPYLDTETSLGKRTTQLDLSPTSTTDVEKMNKLVRGTDVFLQAYRPGGLEGKGFGVDDVLKLKTEHGEEGVVFASLRAWGWDGPWAHRRGFDSLVQTAAGFNADEGEAYRLYMASQGKPSEWRPRPLPMQAIDHAAGYFLAFGINVALARMILEGGSHEVRVSLVGVGRWIRSLGRLDPSIAFGENARKFPERAWPLDEEIQRLSIDWSERQGGKGRKMTALKQAAVFSTTQAKEGRGTNWGAPMRLNADEAEWVL